MSVLVYLIAVCKLGDDMADHKKVTDSIEESIQSLAGDIYVQIEEKVAELVRSSQKNKDISIEEIEKHPHFIAVKNTNSEQLKHIELTHAQSETIIKEQQLLIDTLQQESISQQSELKNIADLNGAKLTDTESVLKEKLSENSTLTDTVKKLTLKEQQQSQALEEQRQQLATLAAEVEQLSKAKENLTKTDQAKAATLNVQNQQISELRDQLSNALAEQAHAKSEFASKIASTTNSVSEHQTQAIQFAKQCETLSQQLEKITKELSEEKARVETLSKEVSEEKSKNTTLEKSASEHETVIKSLQEKVQLDTNEINSLTAKQAEIEKDNQAKITQLNEQLTQQSAAVEALEKSELLVKKLQTKLETVEQKVELQLSAIKLANESNEALSKENTKMQQQLAASAHDHEQLEQQNQTLTANFSALEKENEQHQNQVIQLNKELKASNEQINNVQQRFIDNRGKQESEYTQARETIKYLRDENHVLNEKLTTEVAELETQLTEYRLRFEYAQKQLAKQSE